jgi:hypothetical protein
MQINHPELCYIQIQSVLKIEIFPVIKTESIQQAPTNTMILNTSMSKLLSLLF